MGLTHALTRDQHYKFVFQASNKERKRPRKSEGERVIWRLNLTTQVCYSTNLLSPIIPLKTLGDFRNFDFLAHSTLLFQSQHHSRLRFHLRKLALSFCCLGKICVMKAKFFNPKLSHFQRTRTVFVLFSLHKDILCLNHSVSTLEHSSTIWEHFIILESRWLLATAPYRNEQSLIYFILSGNNQWLQHSSLVIASWNFTRDSTKSSRSEWVERLLSTDMLSHRISFNWAESGILYSAHQDIGERTWKMEKFLSTSSVVCVMFIRHLLVCRTYPASSVSSSESNFYFLEPFLEGLELLFTSNNSESLLKRVHGSYGTSMWNYFYWNLWKWE